MKKHLSFILISFIFSCSGNGTMEYYLSKKVDRYSNDADTVYKRNSSEIDHIQRIFYKKHHTKYTPYVTISNIVGTEKYEVSAMEYDGDDLIGQTLFEFDNKKAFENMLSVMDTILSNKDKDLIYDLDTNNEIGVFVISSPNGSALISQEKNVYSDRGRTLIEIPKSELDSIRNAYSKYKKQ